MICDFVFTERPGHAAELAVQHSPHYDAVFVLGGDGTVMEVAGALAGSDARIGVLAGGTGNLLARALGIPLSVPQRSRRARRRRGSARIDLGTFDSGRRFAIAAGVGIDATMVAETPDWLKRRLGVFAYAIIGSRAALRAVLRRDFFRARVTVDSTIHERDAAAVMIANFGAVLGERITLGPGIRTDDGFLDGCIFSPRTLGDAFRIMWRFAAARFQVRSVHALLSRSEHSGRDDPAHAVAGGRRTDGDDAVSCGCRAAGRTNSWYPGEGERVTQTMFAEREPSPLILKL